MEVINHAPRDGTRRRGRRPTWFGIGLATATALLIATTGIAGTADATFSGNDGLVAFSRGESSGSAFRASLFTMNPDGTQVSQLTHPDWGYQDTNPHWSPDGTRVAFARNDDNAGNADIYVVNANGSGLTRLTACSSEPMTRTCGGYFDPTWTPDGQSLVLTRCCFTDTAGYAHQGIYAMRADGTGLRALTYSPDPNGGDGGPTVSPDGQWVAFSRLITGHNFDQHALSALFLVRFDGTGLHQLTSYNLWVDEKDWSPDGSQIAFVAHTGSNHGPFAANIDTIRTDGTGLTQLSSTSAGQSFAFAPSWSPSGRRIMFDFFPGPDGRTDLYTMLPDGSDGHLIPGTAGDNWPSWGTAPTR